MRPVAHQFNRASSNYTRAAFLQKEVTQRLDERLDYIKITPQRIIDLGCGTGFGINELQKRYPQAELFGVDIAEKILHQAKSQMDHNYVCADAMVLPFADQSVDLIFSSLLLQWCNELLPTLKECYRVLRDGGLFLFTTLGPDTLQELRYSWAQIDKLPHVNEFLDMHDVGDALMHAHFSDPVVDMEYITLTFKDLNSLLKNLKEIGAVYSGKDRRKTLTGKSKLIQLAKHYQQFANAENYLPATYEVIYGLAWKLPRTPKKNPSEIFIDVKDIHRKK